jgi:hypothetical protein
MTLVVKNLLERPHTSASLTQKIGVYSASQINACLSKLKKAGVIRAVKDVRKNVVVYSNVNLDAVARNDTF